MQTAASPIMDRLRTETADLHHKAESSPFQRRLVQGQVSRDEYARYLGQMLLMHRALEARLASGRQTDPRLKAVVTEEQFQVPYLEADLRTLAVDPSTVQPTVATRAVLAAIEQEAVAGPAAVLGMHYVLEGSNNGSKYIAMGVGRALSMTAESGMRYLDPYGPRQREVWAGFKAAMGAQSFTEAECDQLVASAKAMFEFVRQIGEGL